MILAGDIGGTKTLLALKDFFAPIIVFEDLLYQQKREFYCL